MQLREIPLFIPAAGKSSRLGIPKGLYPHRGRPWIEFQCKSFAEAGGRTVLLVLGHDSDEYRRALKLNAIQSDIPLEIGGCEVYVLTNSLPEFGPFSSLQTACRWIPRCNVRSAFYLPIDTPVPSSDVLMDLVEAFQPGIEAVEPRFGQAGGHPVLLSRAFMENILTYDPKRADARLDFLLRDGRQQGVVISVPVTDVRVAINLNDAGAWRNFEKNEWWNEESTLPAACENFGSIVDDDQRLSCQR